MLRHLSPKRNISALEEKNIASNRKIYEGVQWHDKQSCADAPNSRLSTEM
jgi:hypothetical protein